MVMVAQMVMDDCKVGDLALVASLHLPSARGMSKLDMKWRGPYKVLSIVGPMSDQWRGH